MIINIGNKHHGATGEYVGRGSPLGNPWSIQPWRDRATCLSTYKAYLNRSLECSDPAICAEMERLYLLALQGPITLVCFCHPKPCHAELIKEVLICEAIAQGDHKEGDPTVSKPGPANEVGSGNPFKE